MNLLVCNRESKTNILLCCHFCLTLRCLILELASCIVEGSDEDLVNILFSITKRALQVC